jgi:hypothetical protein
VRYFGFWCLSANCFAGGSQENICTVCETSLSPPSDSSMSSDISDDASSEDDASVSGGEDCSM